MPLTSDYREVKTQGWTEEQEDNLSKFCFPMMAIDMDSITKENLEEVWFRFNFLQKIGHKAFRNDVNNLDFYAMLKSYIGFRCNISKLPRYKFVRRWATIVERSVSPGFVLELDNKKSA